MECSDWSVGLLVVAVGCAGHSASAWRVEQPVDLLVAEKYFLERSILSLPGGCVDVVGVGSV